MLNVASMADGGIGAPLDLALACKWYRKAASMGSSRSAAMLANYLAGDRTVARGPDGRPSRLPAAAHDIDQAVVLWTQAADGGDDDAMVRVGRVHASRGALGAAVEWLTRASATGNEDAPLTMSGLYTGGGGGFPRDDELMLRWLKLAVNRGNPGAKTKLDSLVGANTGGGGEVDGATAPAPAPAATDGGCDGDAGDAGTGGGLVTLTAAQAAAMVETPFSQCGNIVCCKAETPDRPDYKRCTGCMQVRYCSALCQRAHWKSFHKKECAAFKAEAAARTARVKSDGAGTTAAAAAAAPPPSSSSALATGPPVAGVRVGQGWAAASISRAAHATIVAAGLVPAVAALVGLQVR